MYFDHMFYESSFEFETQMTVFTLVFIGIFHSMNFGLVSFQDKSVTHLLTTLFTFKSLMNLTYVTFQISRGSKTSGTVLTMKGGSFFMIFHNVFFQIATTSVLFVTKFALKSVSPWWRFFFVWMNRSFVWDHSMFFQENFGTLLENRSLYIIRRLKNQGFQITLINEFWQFWIKIWKNDTINLDQLDLTYWVC